VIPYPRSKRVFDRVLAALLILVLLPSSSSCSLAMLVDTLLVLRDRGPLLRRETRIRVTAPSTY
jgi:hypothetical protein